MKHSSVFVAVFFLITIPLLAGTPSPNDCEAGPVIAGIDATTNSVNGEVLLAATGLELWRSTDQGDWFVKTSLGVAGNWPSLSAVGDDVLLASGLWGSPNRIFLLRSADGGRSFEPAIDIHTSSERLFDPELLRLANGDLLVFLTEVIEVEDVFQVHVFRSENHGLDWAQLGTAIVGPAGIRIEDAKAIELPNGDLLLAYEFEIEDLGSSRIEQIRSQDGGLTWESPTVIWDDVVGSDEEPGGYFTASEDELWFLASTDEDAVLKTYTDAVIKRKISRDGGASWGEKTTLVDVADQILYGVAPLADGRLGLATIRFFTGGPRTAYFYRAESAMPGTYDCSTFVFRDDLETGDLSQWTTSVGVFSVRPGPPNRLRSKAKSGW